MSMIPDNRPVLGKDLDAIRQQYGLLTSDACWLFGLSITRWMQIVRQAPDVPVKDPTLALLVRFLDEHPELSVIPKFPGVSEMYQMVNDVQETDQKRFSVLFGSEASATYRWLRVGSRQSPAVNRLMHYLKSALLARRPAARAELLGRWMGTVHKEAQARGVDDVFKTGQWTPRDASAQKPKRAPRKKADAAPAAAMDLTAAKKVIRRVAKKAAAS